MKRNDLLTSLFILVCCFSLAAQEETSGQHRNTAMMAAVGEELDFSTLAASPSVRWPWGRQGYFAWWSDKVGLRIIQQASFRPGVRFLHQSSELQYSADEAVIGGELAIDSDLLNAVNFPNVIENKLRNISIQLPTGILTRKSQSWTSLAQLEISAVGLSVRGTYWSGALAPARFPQPQDISTLFNPEELVEVAVREIAASSNLNNAVSLEFALHPIHLLTGFRDLEWYSTSGFYLGGDFSIGLMKSTDLTFKQGRELLGDLDLAEEIRDVLSDPLELLIDTDQAADLLLTAIESRLPLYGFGLPQVDGRTFELKSWFGYQWTNTTWSGEARIGFMYQTQRLSNQHPSAPVLRVKRWVPTVNVKWIFNKEKVQSPLFIY